MQNVSWGQKAYLKMRPRRWRAGFSDGHWVQEKCLQVVLRQTNTPLFVFPKFPEAAILIKKRKSWSFLIKKRFISDKKRRELLSRSKVMVFTSVLVQSCSMVMVSMIDPRYFAIKPHSFIKRWSRSSFPCHSPKDYHKYESIISIAVAHTHATKTGSPTWHLQQSLREL